MSKRRISVAIDGPAGAGKSTVSRAVAARLGYVLLDTGALYRSVALAASRRGISWDDSTAVGALAHELAAKDGIQFVNERHGSQRVMLEGDDVSSSIRSQLISEGASKVSAIPEVRAALLEVQRAAGRRGGVVLEGRDIGTVVLPDAEAKFFLTASVDVRAQRRHRELEGRGEQPSYETIRSEVEARDRRDSTRAVAPLRQADDAVLVDSSGVALDEVIGRIVRHVEDVIARLES